jgi:hypothetical protein
MLNNIDVAAASPLRSLHRALELQEGRARLRSSTGVHHGHRVGANVTTAIDRVQGVVNGQGLASPEYATMWPMPRSRPCSCPETPRPSRQCCRWTCGAHGRRPSAPPSPWRPSSRSSCRRPPGPCTRWQWGASRRRPRSSQSPSGRGRPPSPASGRIIDLVSMSRRRAQHGRRAGCHKSAERAAGAPVTVRKTRAAMMMLRA